MQGPAQDTESTPPHTRVARTPPGEEFRHSVDTHSTPRNPNIEVTLWGGRESLGENSPSRAVPVTHKKKSSPGIGAGPRALARKPTAEPETRAIGQMEDVPSGAPPGFCSMGPPVEVRGRRANRRFFARGEGGRGGRGGDGQGVDDPEKALQRQQEPFVHLIQQPGPRYSTPGLPHHGTCTVNARR